MDEKKLLELIKFHVNKKANEATEIKQKAKDEEGRKFWNGYCLACNEIYSMLTNINV